MASQVLELRGMASQPTHDRARTRRPRAFGPLASFANGRGSFSGHQHVRAASAAVALGTFLFVAIRSIAMQPGQAIDSRAREQRQLADRGDPLSGGEAAVKGGAHHRRPRCFAQTGAASGVQSRTETCAWAYGSQLCICV